MHDANTAMIELRGLARRFGEVRAVDGIDLSVARGDLLGLLGPNGAGKSTTLGLLTGLIRPDAGSVRVGGIDVAARPKAAQRLMGVVADESNLYPELSGRENLEFCGALYGMPRRQRRRRAADLLDRFGLAEAAERSFRGYSKGMKRRCAIAAGIMHEPALLILDEPTTGIDLAAARQVRRFIAELNAAGTTVLLTTHYIEEAQRLCRRIAFLVAGRIALVDETARLLERRAAAGAEALELTLATAGGDLAAAMNDAFPELRCQALLPTLLRVESDRPPGIAPLARFLESRGVELIEARRRELSLEEVFVEVTGIEAGVLRREKPARGGPA